MSALAPLWMTVGVLIGLALADTFPARFRFRPDPVDDEQADREADRYERERGGRWGR